MWGDDLFNTLGVNYKTIRSLYIGSHFDRPPPEEIPSAATVYMFSCLDNYTSDLQNLQNSIWTCEELTKFDSDVCRTYKIGQNIPQNSDKCMRPKLNTCRIEKTKLSLVFSNIT